MNPGKYMRVGDVGKRVIDLSALREVFYEHGHIVVRPGGGVSPCARAEQDDPLHAARKALFHLTTKVAKTLCCSWFDRIRQAPV